MLTNKVWYVRLQSREKGGGTGEGCVCVGGGGSALFSQQACSDRGLVAQTSVCVCSHSRESI